MMMNACEFDIHLRDLRTKERGTEVDALLALVEFDRRELYLELGYDKLWTYCMKVLHYCEGATYRRTRAVKILQRFPRLADQLRDGRLNLTTLVELEPVLEDDTVDAVTAQAAYMSKTEVKTLVASLRYVEPPKELAFRRAPRPASPAAAVDEAPAEYGLQTGLGAPQPAAPPPPVRPPFRVEPVSKDQWLLQGRLADRVKQKIERARELASHAIPSGKWEEVIEAALDCYIEQLEKRRAARTEKPRAGKKEPKNRRTISAEVRRSVSERDGGQCAWIGAEGHRCESRWQLEYDHIDPAGPSTVENVRLLCRQHNLLHAERIYGKEHMDQFRRRQTFSGESPRDLNHDLQPQLDLP
jgi:hypothetical protein